VINCINTNKEKHLASINLSSQCQGFITNDVLKDILREIDSTLTEDDLDHIVEEVDEDGSGTMDFDEFQEMMMG
jgi:Ca2+-binding EF-hand superfamily protein